MVNMNDDVELRRAIQAFEVAIGSPSGSDLATLRELLRLHGPTRLHEAITKSGAKHGKSAAYVARIIEDIPAVVSGGIAAGAEDSFGAKRYGVNCADCGGKLQVYRGEVNHPQYCVPCLELRFVTKLAEAQR